MFRTPDDFGGGGDLGPIGGGTGWGLACAYTLGALALVVITIKLLDQTLQLLASVIAP